MNKIENKKVNKGKVFKGKVVKNSSDKTIIVNVERQFMDKKYKKYIKRHKKFSAHDEENKSQIGDIVKIMECKPISKTKKFILLNEKKGATK
mgnify:CR=1 FL=1